MMSMNPDTACQARPEDIRREKRHCWTPNCKRRAWFENFGWHFCPYHMYRNWRWGGGNRWAELRYIRLYWGGW